MQSKRLINVVEVYDENGYKIYSQYELDLMKNREPDCTEPYMPICSNQPYQFPHNDERDFTDEIVDHIADAALKGIGYTVGEVAGVLVDTAAKGITGLATGLASKALSFLL